MTNKDNSFSHVKAVQAAPLKSAKGSLPRQWDDDWSPAALGLPLQSFMGGLCCWAQHLLFCGCWLSLVVLTEVDAEILEFSHLSAEVVEGLQKSGQTCTSGAATAAHHDMVCSPNISKNWLNVADKQLRANG